MIACKSLEPAAAIYRSELVKPSLTCVLARHLSEQYLTAALMRFLDHKWAKIYMCGYPKMI